MIGQSLGLLRAMRANTAENWLEQRIKKYGPISKLSLFGKPTIFIYGPAANKFVFTSDSTTLSNQQTQSSRTILGDRNILELSGEDHKRVRGALVSFLKPESLKQYVGKMDEDVKKHLEMHWQGKQQDLIHEKRMELEQKGASPRQDLISCMLSIRNENNEQVISDKEIVHNVILVMVAGYDTSSVLITFIMRLLANEPAVYAAMLQEHEEIAKSKPSGEFLTWEDLAKMKYTWRVAMETLRIHPPVFGGFRKALKDIEYGGYLIPKGWQVFWVSPMTHMDSSIFPEPSKFDPSRFENQALVPPYSFIAFGAGPRICPGNEFARIETLVTIHYLITYFAWKLCADDSFSRDPTPVPTQGLPIQLVLKKTF
uniref:Cytochrome P450 n=1 Tax=Fagus sylvatica TaxID=28930 RepID=A0A2N9F240_FAGSY